MWTDSDECRGGLIGEVQRQGNFESVRCSRGKKKKIGRCTSDFAHTHTHTLTLTTRAVGQGAERLSQIRNRGF